MNKIIILIFLIITKFSFGQSFEGKLTYKVEFSFNMDSSFGLSEKDMIEHMKKSGEYFDTIVVNIKNGNYEKLVNSSNSKRIVYKSDINKIYTFDKGFEYVLIANAKNYSSSKMEFEKPEFIKNDSIVSVMGKDCKSITLDWNGLGKETYYYNDTFLKIDSELFKSHNYEYLNKILTITKSYPAQINKSLNKLIEIRMILVDYSKEEINDSVFEIPKLKPAEKEYAEIIMETTGNEVMRIKN
ncbi:hypothetical protein [uncultured Lacinutrix sp.]|uniref:hypothetical protein n=1 Tax=uncultured Lacinutrix sp. TaxID=574032 RepID=UPI00260C721E|nr:hypothetical protein [uncultured Lacinutrix sp.]